LGSIVICGYVLLTIWIIACLSGLVTYAYNAKLWSRPREVHDSEPNDLADPAGPPPGEVPADAEQ